MKWNPRRADRLKNLKSAGIVDGFSGTMAGTVKSQPKNHNDLNRLVDTKIMERTMNPLPKRLFTLPEAAHYLGRTHWSLRELVWTGKIPVVRTGKRLFFDIQDMNQFIEKNKIRYEA